MDTYCIYLRKSRADLEAEARGEGETLKKHKTTLLALAKKMKLNITEVYPEIVSGERIMERPVIQHLLQEVEDGVWTGVLVMEVERLARGDTMDQGLVAQAFKYSSTKIITPMKVYDPNNEFDEEYFEFGLFMSRREYKTINRRMQGGRIASVESGNFIGSIPPYGYDRTQLPDGSFTLKPNLEQAPIIKMIFDCYTEQNMGMSLIMRKLNVAGILPAKKGLWSMASLRNIIRNPVYCGKIIWNRRPIKKSRKAGMISKSRPEIDKENWIIVEGKHEALITVEQWDKAMDILSNRSHTPANSGILSNPLAGIVRCEICGHAMIRRPYSNGTPDGLICVTSLCPNISSVLHLVEQRIIEGLGTWINQYKAEWSTNKPDNQEPVEELILAKKRIVKTLEKKIAEIQVQIGNLHDFLERGVYSIDVFLERSKQLSERMVETEKALEEARTDLGNETARKQSEGELIPAIERVLDLYPKIDDPAEKNSLLKTVLEFVTYIKTVKGHWKRPEAMHQFDLTLYPRLPKNMPNDD